MTTGCAYVQGMKFTSVQQVLDFIGTEYEGEKCDAITALQAAVFHQQNQKDGKDPKVLEGKDAKNGKKSQKVSKGRTGIAVEKHRARIIYEGAA